MRYMIESKNGKQYYEGTSEARFRATLEAKKTDEMVPMIRLNKNNKVFAGICTPGGRYYPHFKASVEVSGKKSIQREMKAVAEHHGILHNEKTSKFVYIDDRAVIVRTPEECPLFHEVNGRRKCRHPKHETTAVCPEMCPLRVEKI